MKIKLGIALDGDGHFITCQTKDRVGMIKLLKQIADGDEWANEYENALEEAECILVEELLTANEDSWSIFINCFIQRGRFEINTIEILWQKKIKD